MKKKASANLKYGQISVYNKDVYGTKFIFNFGHPMVWFHHIIPISFLWFVIAPCGLGYFWQEKVWLYALSGRLTKILLWFQNLSAFDDHLKVKCDWNKM